MQKWFKIFIFPFLILFLWAGTAMAVNITIMECGNDNLMGSTAPVPEPATMLLLSTGLMGIAGVTRRKIHKK